MTPIEKIKDTYNCRGYPFSCWRPISSVGRVICRSLNYFWRWESLCALDESEKYCMVKKSKEQPKSFILCYIIRKWKGARYKKASYSIYPTLFTHYRIQVPSTCNTQPSQPSLEQSVWAHVGLESHIFPFTHMDTCVIADYGRLCLVGQKWCLHHKLTGKLTTISMEEFKSILMSLGKLLILSFFLLI